MFFKRLAVVGVVALAAASAASARELACEKHGEAGLADSEAGKDKPVGAIKSVVKAEGTVMTEAQAKEEKLKQKKWKVKSIPPLKKVRGRDWKGGEEKGGYMHVLERRAAAHLFVAVCRGGGEVEKGSARGKKRSERFY